jgi:glycerophosphoryl diester phosphodiesterase
MKNSLFFTGLVTTLMMASSSNALELVAHRGASYDAPENTLAALRLGFEQGADAVECDIYLTQDGRIVLMHDPDTLRTAGVSNRIAVTQSSILRRLDVAKWGQWQGKGFSEPVPYLSEALKLVPEGKRIFIEVKCGPEILPELERVLKASGKKPEQTPLICFNYDTLRQAKERLPKLEMYWLAGADKKKQFAPVEELIEKARAANFDGLDLNYGFPIDKEFVRKVHAAGLKLYTWTVDDPAVAAREAEAGVDGITTNRPQWLREQLGLRASR